MYHFKCLVCSKECSRDRSTSKYCSQECYREFKSKNNGFAQTKLMKGKCRDCDKTISKTRIYCPDCYQAYLDKPRKRYKITTDIKCQHCGVEKTKENTFSPEDGVWSTKCRKCCRKVSKKSEQGIKQQCVDYKGGKCQVCGYDKCNSALDFHHIDPSEKDFTVARRKSKLLDVTMKNELDKCMLLCSNCHREEHSRLTAGEPSLLENLNQSSIITKSEEPEVNYENHWNLCLNSM